MTRARAALSFLAVTACAAFAVFCGSPGEDGAECSDDGDCKSDVCTDGVCRASPCACEGDVCDPASDCQPGWACVRGNAGVSYEFPVCRRECGDGGACASDEHCGADGVCHEGADKLRVAWAKAPADTPCQIFKPCTFEVSVLSGDVDRFEWDLGEADAGAVTTDPSVTHEYRTVGRHGVVVHVFDRAGEMEQLQSYEEVCVAGTAYRCSPGAAECCSGTCIVDAGTCR